MSANEVETASATTEVAGLGLAGQRVVVTGAGSGIGQATAEFLIAHGAQVAALDLNTEGCADLGAAVTAVCDVSNADQVDQAFAQAHEALGGFDTVLHVAGITMEARTDLRELTEEAFRKVLDVNVVGCFLVARAATRVMADDGGGTIVMVGSGAGVIGPSSSIPYGASKGAVNGLAMTLANHLEQHHIRVINFMPSQVDTPLVHRSLAIGEANGADPEIAKKFKSTMATAADVGRALAMYASPLLSHLRGPVFSR